MRKTFIFFLIIGCSITGSQAEESLNLERVLSIALERNPEFANARQRIAAAQGRRIDAGKWSNPELELTADEAPFDGGVGEAKQLAGVKQEIPFPGKKRLDRKIGDSGVVISTDDFLNARLVLIREVTVGFYAAVVAERRLAIAADIRDLASAAALTASKQVEAGSGSAQGQLRAEIEADRSGAEVEDIRQEQVVARERLAALLGDPKFANAPLVGTLGAMPNPALMGVGSYENVIAQHPRLAAARGAQERAVLKLKRERLERWPDVTIAVEAGRDQAFDEDIYGLRFSLPLPIFNRRKGAIIEATAELEIARNEVAATEVLLATRLDAAVSRYRAAARQVESYRDKILPKAANAVKLVERGFAEGKFSLIDMLDTQRTSAAVRLTYEKKLLEMHSTGAEIETFINHFSENQKQNGNQEKKNEPTEKKP